MHQLQLRYIGSIVELSNNLLHLNFEKTRTLIVKYSYSVDVPFLATFAPFEASIF